MRFGWQIWLALLALAWPAIVRAEWRRVEMPGFILHSEGSPVKLAALASELHEFDRLLRLLTGVKTPPSPTRLRIYLVADRAEMRRIAPMGADIAGFYTATPSGIIAVAKRAEDGFNAGVADILRHEYVHHFTFQHFPANYPPWFVEGLAEYFMTVRFKDGLAEVGRFDEARAYGLLGAPWLPFDKVLGASWDKLPDRALAYGQSWLAMHYLYRDSGRAKALHAYLKAVAAGTPSLKAFEAEIGQTPAAFARSLKDYIASRRISYSRIVWRPDPAIAVRVESVPASEAAMLLDTAMLAASRLDGRGVDGEVDGGEERDARLRAAWQADMLKGLRRRAAALPGDQAAQLVRAEAEIRGGDRAAGRALVEARLATAPGDVQALYLKGLALVLDAESPPPGAEPADLRRSARRALAAANQARPDDFRILATYVRAQPRPLSAAALEVLLRAHELAPQVDAIAFDAALSLADADRAAEARALLLPIANSPHASPLARLARAALDTLDNRAKSGEAPGMTGKP